MQYKCLVLELIQVIRMAVKLLVDVILEKVFMKGEMAFLCFVFVLLLL